MKKKYLIALILSLSISTIFYGQELIINSKYADSIEYYWDYNLGVELKSIIVYNEAVKSFGYADTILITKSGNDYTYYYKDSLITDLKRRHSNKQRLVMINFSPDLVLFSTTQQSLTNSFEMVVLNASFDHTDLIYKLSNYTGDVQDGRYEERTKSGKVLVTGQYCQIDSIYIDTLLYFDPETYEDILEIIPRTKFPYKSGIWRYYSPEGILLKEEQYKNCT